VIAIALNQEVWTQAGPLSQKQDHEAALKFEDVVEKYYRPLYQFALSLSHSEAEACDLTQQTFYTWTIKGDQLRDGTKVKAWLFTTLHRAFLQTRRREMRFPHYELGDVASELPWIPPREAIGLDAADVLDALTKIDELFRAPLALFYLEDYAYKDIAHILGVPLGTVKSRIARGIGQLQKLLVPAECECGQEVALAR
jgi:RNA polymerase sigma-70 factor (ECF subfamily)